MGIPSDDFVLIQQGKSRDDPCVVTVNCPDKAGLGCDLCRIVLEFGLCITRGDFSTDGRWCYIVLWVVPNANSYPIDWGSLKNRLFDVCPSFLPSFYFNEKANGSPLSQLYLLKLCCIDKKGLLHDVTEVLCELEYAIQKVKVMTTPDGRVLDLFFITDGMELLHTKKRRDDTSGRLISVLGEFCVNLELQIPGPEYESLQGLFSLPPTVVKELFSCKISENEASLGAPSAEKITSKKVTITVDNFLSPAHTLLQIQCPDQKGLFYDIMRTSKDCNIKVAYGRISSSVKGFRNMDLFIIKTDGKKIVDPDDQTMLCSRLKEEILHPLRVMIANRGPDTQLLVANPVELSGKGRPRVFYDITLALKKLGVCIFSAEIGRHSTSDRQWEVYRFLLDENREFPVSSSQARSRIVDGVTRTLMGW